MLNNWGALQNGALICILLTVNSFNSLLLDTHSFIWTPSGVFLTYTGDENESSIKAWEIRRYNLYIQNKTKHGVFCLRIYVANVVIVLQIPFAYLCNLQLERILHRPPNADNCAFVVLFHSFITLFLLLLFCLIAVLQLSPTQIQETSIFRGYIDSWQVPITVMTSEDYVQLFIHKANNTNTNQQYFSNPKLT